MPLHLICIILPKKPPLGKGDTKTVIPAADSTTPQFRNFYIDHLICEGAARGILLRGLPEMNIQHIEISHATIAAKEGMDIVEAKHILLKDVELRCNTAAPLIHVENSSDLSFDGLSCNPLPETLFQIEGDRSGKILLSHAADSLRQLNNQFNFGSKQSALRISE